MTDSFDDSLALCLNRFCVRIGRQDLERPAVQQKMLLRFFEDAAETAVHCQLDTGIHRLNACVCTVYYELYTMKFIV